MTKTAAQKARAKKKTHAKPKKSSGRSGVPRIHGKGGYFTDALRAVTKPFLDETESKGMVNKAARGLGGALGGATGIPGAGRLLGNAGSWLSRLFGQGAYDVRKNSLMSSVEGAPTVSKPPVFGSIKKGADIIFSHSEFVANVTSSETFSATTYPINPGNPVLFPWMSKIAVLFEEFEMLGLIVEYRSMSATAVGTTSSAMGIVIMATDYDCYDTNYASKRAMEAAEYSSSGVPFKTFIHPIECDNRRNTLGLHYVVPGITTSSMAAGDQRMSVLGNFCVATEGQQTAGEKIGEIWVSYHLRLSRPILEEVEFGSVVPRNAHVMGRTDVAVVSEVTYVKTTSFPWTITPGAAKIVFNYIETQFTSNKTWLIVITARNTATKTWTPPNVTDCSGHVFPNMCYDATSTINFGPLDAGFIAADSKESTLVVGLTATNSACTFSIVPPHHESGQYWDAYITEYSLGMAATPTDLAARLEMLEKMFKKMRHNEKDEDDCAAAALPRSCRDASDTLSATPLKSGVSSARNLTTDTAAGAAAIKTSGAIPDDSDDYEEPVRASRSSSRK